MSAPFSFPPPPPPPPRAAASHSGPDLTQDTAGGSRGGRGRGGFRGARGARGARGRGSAYNHNQRGGSGRGGYQHNAPLPNHGSHGGTAPNGAVSMTGALPQQSIPTYPFPQPSQLSYAPNVSYQQSTYPVINPAVQSQWNPNMFQPVMNAGIMSQQSYSESGLVNSTAGRMTNQSQQTSRRPSLESPGLKRKREEGSQGVKPRQKAKAEVAPPIPAFGFSLPPKPDSNTKPHQLQDTPKKKPRKYNQLGLTPRGEEHVGSDEDVDEESVLAKQGSELKFEYRGRTATLKSPAEIAAWIEERKKKFPTKARIEEQKKIQEQKQEEMRKKREDAQAARQAALEARRQDQKPRSDMKEPKNDAPDAQRLALEKQLKKVEKLKKKLRKSEEKAARAAEAAKALQSAADRSAYSGNTKDGSETHAQEPSVRGNMLMTEKVTAPSKVLSLGINYASDSDEENEAATKAAADVVVESRTLPDSGSELSDSSALSDSSSSSVDDVTSSDSDSGTDSDSDSDNAPEEESSKTSRPPRVAPPNHARREKDQAAKKQKQSQPESRVCISWEQKGYCPRGRHCKFQHPEKRKTLMERLVEQEQAAEEALAFRAILALGDMGMFKEDEDAEAHS